MLFSLSKTEANDTFHSLLEILQFLLPSILLEQVKQRVSDYEIVQELLSEFESPVDSTEQSRERPGDYEEQKKFYSGKKKKPTFTNQLIILVEGQDIVGVTSGKTGLASDINLLRESQKRFAPKQKFKGDKAYKGEANVITPHKKTKKRELSKIYKRENKDFSSHRIVIEYMIRLIKVFRCCL